MTAEELIEHNPTLFLVPCRCDGGCERCLADGQVRYPYPAGNRQRRRTVEELLEHAMQLWAVIADPVGNGPPRDFHAAQMAALLHLGSLLAMEPRGRQGDWWVLAASTLNGTIAVRDAPRAKKRKGAGA